MSVRLTYADRKELEAWLLANFDRFNSASMTIPDVCREGAAVFKFLLTDHNVRNLFIMNNKLLPSMVKKREYLSQVAAAEAEAKIKAAMKAMNAVKPVDPVARRLLALLYEKLGEKVPAELVQYIRADDAMKLAVDQVEV